MVCTRNDLSAWKDFPKGLRVLLLDEDTNSAAEIKSKLEAMDYIVYTFCNENEALSAVSSRPESFHVAIVEVCTNSNNGGFKFLETAKDLPTIMTSNIHCISTMMKCIALGAVEFLRKPLSEDKLRNIWQHVVHKAFSAGGDDLSESLKPVKDYVASMLHQQLENGECKHEDLDKIEDASMIHENDHEPSAVNNKYPAPSTPQLQQGGRLIVNGDCQEHTNCSMEKESGEPDGESKSVETTSCHTIAEVIAPVGQHQKPRETMVKEEADSIDGAKGERTVDSHPQDTVHSEDSCAGAEKPNTVSGLHSSRPNKANRKKLKVDWTTELHKKFVQAVDQLGIDQAIPSRILELMKVEGLTRHNVASHLQKYRMHKRHILPKEDDRRWPRRDQTQRSCHPHKPIMAFPPYHSNPVPVGPVYPMWGTPHPASIQTWGSQGYYHPWQPTESWQWKPYPGVHADAWGCPVMPIPQGNCSTFTQNGYGFHCSSTMDNRSGMPQNSIQHQPAEEVIDEVVKEAINKPWLPLPLGLKPPSTDSVLAELSRQGISTIPPRNQRL
ncbi:Two-component response regulator-like APRR2 [Gossypium australe]|uniref:Two-component response regulator-like APRR2 n=1 Tax=Gossypium australe TaxID=47621 RepID=A0A5B6VJJ8_9ROSI|nr:Two-component response regulator-like APRR2 [Gossypium australe]